MLKLTLLEKLFFACICAHFCFIGSKGINFWRKCKILDRKSDCSCNFIATATYSGWHECNQTPVTIGTAPSEKMGKDDNNNTNNDRKCGGMASNDRRQHNFYV